MSDQHFPALPGLGIGIKRSTLFSTLVQVAVSSKEIRASFWSNPRYNYEITFNFLRQSGYSQLTLSDELAVLKTFFEYHKGQYETFLIADPVDGIQRRVRFAQDNMDLEKLLELLWACGSLKLITVKP